LTRKIAIAVVFILLLFAGIIALTQETDGDLPVVEAENEFDEGEDVSFYPEDEPLPEWIKDARWFRSNSGGMALEEIPSRLAALRNEYALVIDIAAKEELPEYLHPFYDDLYFIETRVLYKKGEQARAQWIFRDADGRSRLAAVFKETEAAEEPQVEVLESEDEFAEEESDEDFDNDIAVEILADKEAKNSISGFIELYDENSFLTAEYRFLQDGGRSRTDYAFKDGILLSSTVLLWEESDDEDMSAGQSSKDGQYVPAYADFFRYNRSAFLRSVQRVFYKDSKISSLDDPAVVAFPAGIMAAAREKFSVGERHNSYPEFFGDIFAEKDSKIVYSTDEKGRILSQTFYDEDEEVIWVIYNTWRNERIVSTLKEEDGSEYLAEYEYDSGGERTLEKNYKNGVLERVVRTEGKTDIEELYLNGKVILQSVWENGRKISETRIR